MAATTDYILQFVPLILIFLLFYFMMIRPNQKRIKAHNEMINSLKKGDEVVTHAGIFGKIVSLGQDWVILEIANGVQIKHQLANIGMKIEKDKKE